MFNPKLTIIIIEKRDINISVNLLVVLKFQWIVILFVSEINIVLVSGIEISNSMKLSVKVG